MPLNLSRVIMSPRLRNTSPFAVKRATGSFVKGVWTPGPDVTINAIGIEAGVSEEEVLQLPEGDRIQGLKKFFMTIKLQGATTTTTPDRIPGASGDIYQVKTVDNRMVNGFYSAICVRIKGA